MQTDNKKELRKDVIRIRNDMKQDDVEKRSAEICLKIRSLDAYQKADIVLVYMSFDNEVNLTSLIEDAELNDKRVYIPRVEGKRKMIFLPYSTNSTDLERSSYGIEEPVLKDEKCILDLKAEYEKNSELRAIIVMPGVAFDLERNRLGYGGGYYDSYLKTLEGLSIDIVAAAFETQIVDKVPSEDHDIKCEILVTEDRIIM